MKLPETVHFKNEEGTSYRCFKASDAPGQVGALYLPEGRLELTITRPNLTNTLPLGFKFYASTKVPFDRARIEALRDLPTEDQSLSCLALPVSLGWRGNQQEPCGFFMPLFEGHKGLDACFPYETYLDLCDHKRSDGPFIVAANLAFAVHQAHSCGLTIGDFNPKNFMVDPKTGLVRVIDVDGMQFYASNGRTFRADVIQPEYISPFLSNSKPLPIQHDLFSMALLIFRILNLGPHPFYLNRSDDRIIPPEHDMQNQLYGYVSSIAEREHFVLPPGLMRPSEYSQSLSEMFVEAFTSDRPPTALKWYQALSRFVEGLQACSATPGHMHPAGEPCYLCAFERRSRKRPSLYRGSQRPPAPFKLADKENIIIGAEQPAAAPPPPPPPPRPAPAPPKPAPAPTQPFTPKPSPPPSKPTAPPAPRPYALRTYDDAPVHKPSPSPQSSEGLFKGIGGLLVGGFILLVLLGMCSGPSSKSVVYQRTGLIWYANDSTTTPAGFFSDLRSLSQGACRNADVSFDITSFYAGSAPLSITRQRLQRLQNQIEFTSRSLSFKQLSFSTRVADLSRHPRSSSPSPSQRRGRSIVISTTCRR